MDAPHRRARAIVAQLRAMGDPANVEGQARFGLTGGDRLGIRVTDLRSFGRPYRGDHALALALWDTGVHEAMILATIIDDPAKVTKKQMEDWVRACYAWDLTDACATGLFDETPHAWEMAHRWSTRRAEFQKRAAFAIVAGIAVHDKGAPDQPFLEFLSVIEREGTDDRNYVRKAVNWSLRQIGKRNTGLHAAAIGTAERLSATNLRAARWIAADALRELRSEAVVARLAHARDRARGSA